MRRGNWVIQADLLFLTQLRPLIREFLNCFPKFLDHFIIHFLLQMCDFSFALPQLFMSHNSLFLLKCSASILFIFNRKLAFGSVHETKVNFKIIINNNSSFSPMGAALELPDDTMTLEGTIKTESSRRSLLFLIPFICYILNSSFWVIL